MRTSTNLRPRLCGLFLALLLPACTEKGTDDTKDGTTTDAPDTDATDTDAQPTDAQDTEPPPSDTEPPPGDTEPLPSDTDTDTDTEGPIAGCECGQAQPCGVALCDTAELDDELETTGGAPDPAFEAALKCSLEALRDGKAGRIGWKYYANAGQYNEYGVFLMFGDGTMISQSGGVMDLCETLTPEVILGNLESSSVYADCLADPDLDAQFSCLRGALGSSIATCQAGETDCNGV